MSDSPAPAEERQLRDIHIQVKLPAKNNILYSSLFRPRTDFSSGAFLHA